jgi:four helix bundle protein
LAADSGYTAVVKDFRNLSVWAKAHAFTLDVYRVTRAFPDDERFGLTAQLRRASASIAANLAEGCGRSSDADFARFVTMAIGSASESEYHLLLAGDLGILPKDCRDDLMARIAEIKRMLAGLLDSLHRGSRLTNSPSSEPMAEG